MNSQVLVPAMASGGGGGFSGGTVPGNTIFSGNVAILGTLDVTGVATFTTTVTGSGDIMAGAAFALGFTGRARIYSSADAVLEFRNAANNANASGTFLNVTATGLVLAAGGSSGAPSLSFTGDPNTGFYNDAADRIYWTAGASFGGALIGDAVKFLSTGIVQWAPAGNIATAYDAAIGRSAAAVVGLYGASASLGSSLALASDKQISWSGTTDPDGVVSAMIGHSTTNMLSIYGGSVSSAGYLRFGQPAGIFWSTDGDPDSALTCGLASAVDGVIGVHGSDDSVGGILAFASNKVVRWSSTTDPDGTADFAIGRTSAGLGQIENGSGTLEDLKADYFWLVNEGTNGSDVATMTNGPAGTAGNPDKWLKVKGSDGTVYVIPAWTPT